MYRSLVQRMCYLCIVYTSYTTLFLYSPNIQVDVLVPSDLTSTYTTSPTSSSESPSLAKLTIQRHRQSTLYNVKQIYSSSNTSTNTSSNNSSSNSSIYNNVYTTRGVIIKRDTFMYEVCIQGYYMLYLYVRL